MTIGSGIGGGLIVNGEIYRGAGRGAAEVGHLPVVDESANGHITVPLEKAASGWAIAERARQTALSHPAQARLLRFLRGLS
jgi:glucokinase